MSRGISLDGQEADYCLNLGGFEVLAVQKGKCLGMNLKREKFLLGKKKRNSQPHILWTNSDMCQDPFGVMWWH